MIDNNQLISAITLSSSNPPEKYAIEKTNYQRKTYHETAAPYKTSVVSVTQGGGNFNRRAEMSEVFDCFITFFFFFSKSL